MKLELFSVYDSKAAAYLPLFQMPKIEQALRTFTNCANDDKHQFGANPGDYTLFHLGNYDDDNAKFQIKETPENLGLAQEFKATLQEK